MRISLLLLFGSNFVIKFELQIKSTSNFADIVSNVSFILYVFCLFFLNLQNSKIYLAYLTIKTEDFNCTFATFFCNAYF